MFIFIFTITNTIIYYITILYYIYYNIITFT